MADNEYLQIDDIDKLRDMCAQMQSELLCVRTDHKALRISYNELQARYDELETADQASLARVEEMRETAKALKAECEQLRAYAAKMERALQAIDGVMGMLRG